MLFFATVLNAGKLGSLHLNVVYTNLQTPNKLS
jgi:hypothetical protein